MTNIYWIAFLLGYPVVLSDTDFLNEFVHGLKVSGLHVLFCIKHEEMVYEVMRDVTAKEENVMVKVWQSINIANLKAIPGENLAIMVQPSCNNHTSTTNTSLLEKLSSQKMFNSNYKWVMLGWSLEDMDKLELRLDSDVKMLDQDEQVLDVYKMHLSLPVISTLLKPPFYLTPSRDNLQGIEVDSAIISNTMSGFMRENESFDALADRKLHPESAAKLVSLYPLLKDISDIYNFSYKLHKIADWGIKKEKGWTGMMGLIERGECELCLSISFMRKDRLPISDMLQQLVLSNEVFIFLEVSGFGKWDALLVPFTDALWLGSFLMVLGFVGVLYFASKMTNHPELPVPAAIELIASSLAQQGNEMMSRWLGVKLLNNTIIMFCFMLFTYYCSQVLNSLLSESPTAIHNLQQLLDSDFKLALLDVPYFKNLRKAEISFIGPLDALTLNLLDKIENEKKHYYTFEESKKLVTSGRLALLTSDNTLHQFMANEYTEREICSAHTLFKYTTRSTVNLKKHSPFTELLSVKFNWMREVGLIKRMHDYYFTKKPECMLHLESVSLSLKGTGLAFSLVLVAIIISLFILIQERLIRKRRSKRIY